MVLKYKATRDNNILSYENNKKTLYSPKDFENIVRKGGHLFSRVRDFTDYLAQVRTRASWEEA